MSELAFKVSFYDNLETMKILRDDDESLTKTEEEEAKERP